MFKVLIVDDEPFVREGLKSIINWEEYGFVTCGEANDGVEGLQLMKSLYPDIVITDIRMPEMDGFQLITTSKEMNLKAQFLVLSGYSDFNYVQKAIKNDVVNFLLKPIDEEELIEVLIKIRYELEKKQLSTRIKVNNTIKELINNGDKNIIYYEESEKIKYNYLYDNESLVRKLLECIEKENITSITSVINEMFNDISNKIIEPQIIRAHLTVVISRIITLISKKYGNTESFMKSCDFFKYSGRNSIKKMQKDLIEISINSWKYIQSLSVKNANIEIMEVENYIKNNYNNELSLKKLSEIFHISPAYLGQLFKKRLGLGFNDYLNNIRIEEAKKLLRRSNLKLCEIASIVGYSETNYFINKFEKVTNVTPTQYKNGK